MPGAAAVALLIAYPALLLVAVNATSAQPDWFQTTPEAHAGPTATGAAPFLVQTNPAPYLINSPLQTSLPISGTPPDASIFHLLGNQSPYYVPKDGFGVEEYPLPPGTNITQVHLLHRHGSRYPSSSEPVVSWAPKIDAALGNGSIFTGELAFLNTWRYGLGLEILVPKGRQELFDSGVLHFYNYGALYDNTTKIVARTTTEDRMLRSAENFLAGFFGLDWAENANLLPIIESPGFNNSLSPDYACANALSVLGTASVAPTTTWANIYLKDATARLKKQSGSYNWTVADSLVAQNLCTYETISVGFSQFCQLFTYEEWEGFEYYIDVEFATISGFQSPVARAMGIGWVQEFLARVQGHLLDVPAASTPVNLTLDTNPITFPVNQGLYLDFTHDAYIVTVLTAFGFKQFAEFLPATGPPKNRQYVTSKLVPFGGHFDIEILKAPHEVQPRRAETHGSPSKNPYVRGTGETYYVHFVQNQRTLPLHASFSECEYRDDGWCELKTFLAVQSKSLEEAEFEYSCTGNWTVGPYGSVTNGVPAS